MSLNLCILVKNEPNIGKTIQSAIKYVSKIFICDTGSTDNTIDIIKKICPDVYLMKTKFENFSQARNELLDFADSHLTNNDYILLLDGDDVFVAEYDFRENIFKHQFDIYLIDSVWTYHTGSKRTHKKTAIIKSNCDIRYENPVHEFINLENRKMISLQNVMITQFRSKENEKRLINRVSSFDIPILLKELNCENGDGGDSYAVVGDVINKNAPRNMFYLGNSYSTLKDYNSAIKWYKKRLKYNTNNDELYDTLLNLGNCYKKIGKIDDALITYLDAYDMNEYSGSLLKASYILMLKKRFNMAILLLESIIVKNKTSETHSSFDMNIALGNYIYCCFHVFKFYKCKQIPLIDQTIEIQKFLIDPTIVIIGGFCKTHDYKWDLNSLDNDPNISGSEINSLELAKELTKNGKKVIFVCQTKEPIELIDGILNVNIDGLDNLVKSANITSLIACRNASFLRFGKWKSFLMLDDLNIMGDLSNIGDATVICKTKWHSSHVKKVYNLKSIVIPNAVHSDKYIFNIDNAEDIKDDVNDNGEGKRGKERGKERGSIIYSNDQRSIDELCKIITKIGIYGNYDFKLYIYAMDEDYIKSKLTEHNLDRYKNNIIVSPRLTHDNFIKELETKQKWIYTPWWRETFCITAVEMMLSGVLCIHNGKAGLGDVIGENGIKINDINNVNDYIKKKYINSKFVKKKLINARNYAKKNFDWSNVIKTYLKYIV